MTRTVWSLSSGEYSSYKVLALYERKEDAERAVEVANRHETYPDNFVEEFTLCEPGADLLVRREYSINVRILIEEQQITARPYVDDELLFEEPDRRTRIWERGKDAFDITTNQLVLHPEMYFRVHGFDRDAVTKTYKDHLSVLFEKMGWSMKIPDIDWSST
jgi:hypothetical protein